MRRLLALTALIALTGLFRPKPYGGNDATDATVRLNIGSGPAASLTDATVRLRAHLTEVTAKPANASANEAETTTVDAPPTTAPTAPGDQFTAADAAALYTYSSGEAWDMNAFLRGKLEFEPSPETVAEIQANIDRTSLALSHLPDYPATTVRGVNHSNPEVSTAPYQIGAVVTEQGFVSTTTDPSVAETAFDGNTIYVVTGETGSNIQPYSKNGFEQEVLYDYGTDFLVEDRYTDPETGQTIIEMTEVPRD